MGQVPGDMRGGSGEGERSQSRLQTHRQVSDSTVYIPPLLFTHTNISISIRALARMGSVYVKRKDLENAVKYFDKSLAEHRNPDIVAKKNEVT